MATLPEKIELQVVTPERHILSEDVDSLELPARDGYLGVLPGHAPLITELGVGILTYHKGGETRYLTAMYGYAEVLPDRVIVLAEIAERAEEIDIARARGALERAKSDLPKAGSTEADWDQSNAAIQRAEIRLQVATMSGSGGSSGTSGSREMHRAAA
jgi:F-type H+-transporting ATPase subunit epsilon